MKMQDKPRYMFTEGGVVRYMLVTEIQREYFTNPNGKTFRSWQWINTGLLAGATTVAALVTEGEIRHNKGRVLAARAARISPFGQPSKGSRRGKKEA